MNSIAGLWQLYQHTVFLMSQPLAPWVRFAIVTACNPEGRICAAGRNRGLDLQLQASIRERGCRFRALVGASPDLQHQEKSWALLMDKSAAIGLAEEYRQNAMYWVEQDQLLLTPVLLRARVGEISLGSFRQRLHSCSSLTHMLTNEATF